MEVPKLDLEFLHPTTVSQNTYKQRSLPLKPGRKHCGNDKVFTYESYTSRVPSKKHEIMRQFDNRVTARDEIPIQTHRLIGVNDGGGRERNIKVTYICFYRYLTNHCIFLSHSQVSNSVLNQYGDDFMSINIKDIAPVGDFQCCEVNVKNESTHEAVEYDDLLTDAVHINQYDHTRIDTTLPPSTPLELAKIGLGSIGISDDLRIPNHVIEKLIVSNLDTGSIYKDKQKEVLSKTRYTLQQFEEDERYRLYLNTLIYHSSDHIDLNAVQHAAIGTTSDTKNHNSNSSVLTTRRLIGKKKDAEKDNKPLKSNLRSLNLPATSVSSVDTTGLYYVSSAVVTSDEAHGTLKGIEPIIAKPIYPVQPPRSVVNKRPNRSNEPAKLQQGAVESKDHVVSPPRVQIRSPTNIQVIHPTVDVKFTCRNEDSLAPLNEPLVFSDVYSSTYLTDFEMRELNDENHFANNIFYTGIDHC